MKQLINYINNIQQKLIKLLKEANTNSVVIGISGGIDSALALAIINEINPKVKIYAYFLNINNSWEDKEMVGLLKQKYSFIKEVDLTPIYNSYKQSLANFNFDDFVFYNMKPKIRLNFLYAIANQFKAIVISNLNYDEYSLGFFTKNGDSLADFHILVGLIKSDIIKLAKYYQIPEQIINRLPTPSNEENVNESDEAYFGFSYQELDDFQNFQEIDEKIQKKIINRYQNNQHKHFVIDENQLFKKYRLKGKYGK